VIGWRARNQTNNKTSQGKSENSGLPTQKNEIKKYEKIG